jgi:hypothetical protein
MSALGSAIFAAADMRHDASKSYSGGLGVSAGLLTYTAFAHGRFLTRLPGVNVVFVTLLFGLYFRDYSVLGGTTAGYLAFLLAL